LLTAVLFEDCCDEAGLMAVDFEEDADVDETFSTERPCTCVSELSILPALN
jgi:hypothetical protein